MLLGVSSTVCAQQEAASASTVSSSKTTEPAVARVEIKAAGANYDPRRDDTASKTVINQEELTKYGDTNVYDVLKRAPGVTVIGNSIRMRGLGNGYTQILVNGERPAPGFSLENLPPAQIEKIEIVRAASAEFSMQAIAGTINIVLKKAVAKPQRDVRLSMAPAGENKNAAATVALADRSGNLSYFLNATASKSHATPHGQSGDQFASPEDELLQLRDSRSAQDGHTEQLIVQPRLNWKLANGDQLNLGGFAQTIRTDNEVRAQTTNRIGSFPAPDYVGRSADSAGTIRYVGLDATWGSKPGGGKLDVKVSVNLGHVENAVAARYDTAVLPAALQRNTQNDNDYQTITSTGKYARSILEGHSLATGWEISNRQIDEKTLRIDRLSGAGDIVVSELFRPEVQRIAAYVQDEWNVSKQWSLYLGVRSERITTDSTGTGIEAARSRSQVLSPVAQSLYKFPDKSGRQLRFALTRTYKAPEISQLSARRYVAPLNTRFNPDSSGNPDLKPELATGLDLTYEHFWAPAALFSVGVSERRISDYIQSTLQPDQNGLWLDRPVNNGRAQVRTLDVEAKFPLKAVWKTAPAIDVRASASRNWSKVESVPGPDNRLNEQVPFNAVLGFDYKADKLSTGASFAYRAGGRTRLSEQQDTQQYRRRDLETYILYKVDPHTQLRIALSNLLGEDTRTRTRYRDTAGTSETWTLGQASPRLQVTLELKL
jgi:outer membrane receptor for ferrienterochelin and colicins